MTVAILGCGYTGTRVAERLLARGVEVIATSRRPETLTQLSAKGARVIGLDVDQSADTSLITNGVSILYSIPQVSPALIRSLDNRPSRIVHLSTTGVYGAIQDVNHQTMAQPREGREIERYRQETLVAAGAWSTLTLRAAAIYGPGRGIHVSMARGEFRLAGDGSNYVSRIHVEDLAALAEAALSSSIAGAYPVGDSDPCRSIEIANFCSRLLRVPLPQSAEKGELDRSRQANRRVDGSQIRRLLSVPLQYPSYRDGIPAALDKMV
ncbi:MAG: NAD(P)H-binding protein [Bryobacteraceae bacterium]